jgi:transcriptional regulator
MYIPKAFQQEDRATLHALMHHYSFATLVTQHDGLPFASHLPLTLRPDDGPQGTLVGHMARANPQWRDFAPGQEVLVIFQGPHAYISPSWYALHPSVPTWNYAAVHAYGVPQIIADSTELYMMLQSLVQTYEAPRSQPWHFDLPEDYLQQMMQGIVGFTIRISRLEGKCKLSQNRPLGDQQRVAVALEHQGDALSAGVADLMHTHVLGRAGREEAKPREA